MRIRRTHPDDVGTGKAAADQGVPAAEFVGGVLGIETPRVPVEVVVPLLVVAPLVHLAVAVVAVVLVVPGVELAPVAVSSEASACPA